MGHREKDPGNLDMIGRMLTAAGARLGGYDPDQLARLVEVRAAADQALVRAVAGQRTQGVTWASIAEALGVTKEAAIMNYGPKIRELGWDG